MSVFFKELALVECITKIIGFQRITYEISKLHSSKIFQ